MTGADDKKQNVDPAKIGTELRMKMLKTIAEEIGLRKSAEYQDVWGVIMDWPIGKETASVVALSDGNSSLYTTSAFGVIGGFGHENVRLAAQKFIRMANGYYKEAKTISEYPYPDQDKVKFYLLTFSGVKVIDGDLLLIQKNEDKHADLFGLGQEVLTELRKSTEK